MGCMIGIDKNGEKLEKKRQQRLDREKERKR